MNSGDDGPRIWVQVQVVYDSKLGGAIITRQLHLPADEDVPEYGKGGQALVNKAADDVIDEILRRGLP